MDFREQGLKAAFSGRWSMAVTYLTLAARAQVRAGKIIDTAVLDALAEAAYRTETPEALSPFQNYYKYPLIAAQMARAFLMLGDKESTKEFLGYSSDSPLKAAIEVLLNLDNEDSDQQKKFMEVARQYPELNYGEYWRALAAVADAQGDMELVRMAEQRSQKLAYSDPNVHFNQALRFLAKKEFVAGWKQYEARLIPGAKNHNRTQLGQNIPMWEGQSIAGKRLAVFLEQGLGDLLFALRYVKPLREMGAEVTLIAREGVQEIVRTSFPDVEVFDEHLVQQEEFWKDRKEKFADYWCYSLSAPAKTGLFQPVNTGAFLKAAPSLVENARSVILSKAKDLPIYTVNWHGRIDTKFDRSRAFTVSSFLEVTPILNQPSVVISVQKDATHAEIAEFSEKIQSRGGVFIDAGPELKDFSHTAAWIAASDELWTCDTSVSHLGGGLGHPTHVLVRNKKIWQWVPRRDDQNGGQSAWYDSAFIHYALLNEKLALFSGNDDEEKKTAWKPQPQLQLTDEIRKQFGEQLEKHLLNGNHQAAETIRRVLEGEK